MPPSQVQTSTDEYLLVQIATGDEIALSELYQRFSRRIHALARRILGSIEEADDITQEVFIKIWERANTFFEQRGNAASWIMTVAHHTSIDALRRRLARRTDHPDNMHELTLEPDQDPLEQAMLSRAMLMLNQTERHLIGLAFFSGYSHSQIAKQTELPLGTVKSRVRIALEKLERALTQQPLVES